MMGGFYDVLGGSDSSDSEERLTNSHERTASLTNTGGSDGTSPSRTRTSRNTSPRQPPPEQPSSVHSVDIPSFEDLSTLRVDEETVLRAVYGDDFTVEDGFQGRGLLLVFVRPLGIDAAEVGSSLLLAIRVGRQYPYVTPKIEIRNVKGLSQSEQSELMDQLRRRADQLASSGSVMMLELVQVAEKFLFEHNRNPTMSAWEQMRAREKLQKDRELHTQNELSQLLDKSSKSNVSESTVARIRHDAEATESEKGNINPDDLERELVRQRHALEEAYRKGRELGLPGDGKKPSKIDEDQNCSSSDDDDDGDDASFGKPAFSSSRYKNDFIELGILGRGGGGEVVKVRNRLDRRIYAIKKIILESEQGRHAKFGVVQNRKLRREVTTISRMTHKNIVRYYQAWVEGEGDQIDSELGKTGSLDDPVLEMINDDVDEEDDESAKGWWTTAPQDRSIAAHSGGSHVSSDSYTEGDSSEENDEFDEITGKTQFGSDETSTVRLGFESPLLDGLGFQNRAYQSMVDKSKQRILQSKESEGDDFWDDSLSAHVGDGVKGRSILYIQMQYCETTLRKLIDEGNVAEMQENDVWRLVRQILEALAYIHEQKIVSTNGHDLTNSESTATSGSVDLMEHNRTTTKATKVDGVSVADWDCDGLNASRPVWSDYGERRNNRHLVTPFTLIICPLLASHSHDFHSHDLYSHDSLPSLYQIHRDLKPGNIFLDSEGNIQLGDFGLATRHPTSKTSVSQDVDAESETTSMYDAIEDTSRLLGGSAVVGPTTPDVSGTGESMTGGVGTTFYRAPEQEANQQSRRTGKKSTYTVKADIFSFGIILFEMFHPPFETYMERAGTLSVLRGEGSVQRESQIDEADSRFPVAFSNSVTKKAQNLILRCLEKVPEKRPSAKDILTSDMLPRKIELEQKYLEEALELLTSAESESNVHILNALFARPSQDVVDMTFDTDVAVKANNLGHARTGKRMRSPSEQLMKAILSIRAGAVDFAAVGSLAMSASSMMAATAALNRAELTGRLGKGGKGMQKRATQRVAGVLAMRSATAAAVTGAVDGVLGADPCVVDNVCSSIQQIFRNHGAVQLKTPLLRPRQTTAYDISGAGPVELLNSRGVVLTLPQDLTGPLARSVGRGGAATANMKRFDIDRVYQKSATGGHPRESLEASFDIIQEDHRKAAEIQAEAILVVQQVMTILHSNQRGKLQFDAESPLWFCRIGHTRLADTILDLCGVPTKEVMRRYILSVFSRFLAPSPFSLTLSDSSKKMRYQKCRELLKNQLEYAVSTLGLPQEAVEKIEIVLAEMPMPATTEEGLAYLKRVITSLRSTESKDIADPKRLKRFEDSARNLRELIDFLDLIEVLLQPHFNQKKTSKSRISRPLFFSIDLGLRQRRRTYHGGVTFQAIVLPDNYFDDLKCEETNEDLILVGGRGMKIATGGEFSELVRKNRPPGNFAPTFLERYTTSPIPFCFGVRFSVGKIVELLYIYAAMDQMDVSQDISSISEIPQLRKLLGHPMNAKSVDAVVASGHGMDSSSLSERFLVSSRLWAEGVAAEYLAQSGVMLSLLKRIRDDCQEPNSTSDWSLEELYGVCALLKIPYLVIVQPHLLREKDSVRLIRILVDATGNKGSISSESFVPLDSLAAVILDGLSNESDVGDIEFSQSTQSIQLPLGNSKAARVRCILIDNDVYFGGDHDVSKHQHWKLHHKTMKKVEIQAETFLGSTGESHEAGMDGVPAFSVLDATFWALRDFGTALMRLESNEQSAKGAYLETAQKYPDYKRSLKTLADAIDYFIRKARLWHGNSNRDIAATTKPSRLTALLYSKKDDRFDVITLYLQSQQQGGYLAKRK